MINKDQLIDQQVASWPAVKLTFPSQMLHREAPREKKIQYLQGTIGELVGEDVAINLSGGGHPGQDPSRMCYTKWTKVCGRIEFYKLKNQVIIITKNATRQGNL